MATRSDAGRGVLTRARPRAVDPRRSPHTERLIAAADAADRREDCVDLTGLPRDELLKRLVD